MSELVSCIMATRDRPQFVAQALRCFLRQTYKNSELIVVDDGKSHVGHLCSGLPRVRHVRRTQPTHTGTKLNIAVRHAQGTILQKLDDDDYYHPDFLKRAVAHVPRSTRARSLVAWDCFLVLLAGEAEARFSGHGWTAGGTFCFRREFWERRGFRSVTGTEDYWFLRDHDPWVVPVCAPELYMLVRHGRNAWKRMRSGQPVDAFLRGLPAYGKSLEELFDPADVAFYRALPGSLARPPGQRKVKGERLPRH